MTDGSSVALGPTMNAAFVRWFVAFVGAGLIALVVQPLVGPLLGFAVLFSVLAGGFVGIAIVRARSPRLLTLAPDGVVIHGPAGETRV